ncbi:outer membrane lipoprotein carrier protein LolA [bacterium]
MKKLFSLTLAVFTALIFMTAVSAQEEGEAPDAKKLYDGLSERIKNIKSYRLIFEYTEYIPKKKTEEWRKCEFWFMGRDFMRLEVLDGVDKGSKVAYNVKRKKNKAYAKAGYMPLAIPIAKDDERIEGFFKSDWESDLKSMAEKTKDAEFSLAGEEKIKGRDAYKIEISISDEEAEHDRILLWIDKKESILLQYENYKDEKFADRKTWYEIELDVEMNPKSFKP